MLEATEVCCQMMCAKWYIAIPGLHLPRPISKNFIGQTLLAGMTTHVLLFSLLPSGLSFNSYCSFRAISDLRSHSLSLHLANTVTVKCQPIPMNSLLIFFT